MLVSAAMPVGRGDALQSLTDAELGSNGQRSSLTATCSIALCSHNHQFVFGDELQMLAASWEIKAGQQARAGTGSGCYGCLW